MYVSAAAEPRLEAEAHAERAAQRHSRDIRMISFPSEDEDGSNLGDIAISVETAAVQAKENGLTFEGEVAQLILHGLLHLSGYDHQTDNGEMNRLELRLRRKLKI